MVVPVSTRADVRLILCVPTLGEHIPAYPLTFHSLQKHLAALDLFIYFFLRLLLLFLQSTYEEELNCVGLEHISGHSVEWLLSTYSLPFHSPSSGSWQPLGLHIIWVISLYFYAADVSPCQQAFWQSKMENPPLLKCCTWVPPSPLSVALPTRTFVIPWDTVPCPILIEGKHILINACVCTEVCRSDTQEHKDSDLLYFCGWLDD